MAIMYRQQKQQAAITDFSSRISKKKTFPVRKKPEIALTAAWWLFQQRHTNQSLCRFVCIWLCVCVCVCVCVCLCTCVSLFSQGKYFVRKSSFGAGYRFQSYSGLSLCLSHFLSFSPPFCVHLCLWDRGENVVWLPSVLIFLSSARKSGWATTFCF